MAHTAVVTGASGYLGGQPRLLGPHMGLGISAGFAARMPRLCLHSLHLPVTPTAIGPAQARSSTNCWPRGTM